MRRENSFIQSTISDEYQLMISKEVDTKMLRTKVLESAYKKSVEFFNAR